MSKALKVLTFNMQVGIVTERYRHYVTRSWEHVLPGVNTKQKLNLLVNAIREHDVIAIQEADEGSLRSSGVNWIEYLANEADMPHWFSGRNRSFGRFARHSMGLISRFELNNPEYVKLPGKVSGRGAIIAEVEAPFGKTQVAVTHLALNQTAQNQQLGFLADKLGDKSFVLMGDFNCEHLLLVQHQGFANIRQQCAIPAPPSYPRWQPKKGIDHIITSEDIDRRQYKALDMKVSDHCALSATLYKAK